MKFVVRPGIPRAAHALEQVGVHPLLARLFAARGIQNQADLDDGMVQLLPPSA
jgi:single-stranded-DNA-specific exonuclease